MPWKVRVKLRRALSFARSDTSHNLHVIPETSKPLSGIHQQAHGCVCGF